MVSRQQIKERQKQAYFDALDWTAEEFFGPGIAVTILHGLDDVIIYVLALLLLLCFHIKVFLLLSQASYCVLGVIVCPEARI